ncbi:MAG: hypothetical protein R3F54_20600 [Alphaproteobacteria bacterium]
MRVLIKMVKGVALYAALLAVVTGGAAIVGCLFLHNGRVEYLTDPEALFHFLWVTRAGLKVTIVTVTTIVFLMMAENGALSQNWSRWWRRNLPVAGRTETAVRAELGPRAFPRQVAAPVRSRHAAKRNDRAYVPIGYDRDAL